MQPNSSVITEDIYLKLSSCSLSKGELIPVGEVILQFFLTKLCPFFDMEFSKCSYNRALAPACGAVVSLFTVLLKLFHIYIESGLLNQR